ncbi:MAG: ATP-binding protein [Gammaproteobacteria bacterium SHHR-1]
MQRFFNNAGPIKPEMHYHLPLLQRMDWQEIQQLIREQRYFVLHAPRQTGKTSTLLAMMKALNASGDYACAYANIEGAQAARGDETQGIPTACSAIARSVEDYTQDPALNDWWTQAGRQHQPQDQLTQLLRHWAKVTPKPTVLLLDEVDALVGDTLISLLRQIRAGYAQRPEYFPQSIVLCGVRDVRDYRMEQEGAQVITGGSAFNIKATSLRMDNFTEAETQALWLQHTEATGQIFDPAIFPELWQDSRGQPWLVNALGYAVTWEDREARERSRPIGLVDYKAARERLIQSRATHLDQLSNKLKEARVHGVIARLLSTEEEDAEGLNTDDLQYVADLGLITLRPSVRISNRITEFGHFIGKANGPDVIMREYPMAYDVDSACSLMPYYPLFTQANQTLFERYKQQAAGIANLSLLGRLAEYKYYDMDDAVYQAMQRAAEVSGWSPTQA